MAKKKRRDKKVPDISKLTEAQPEVILRKYIEPLGRKISSERGAPLLLTYYPHSADVGMSPPDVSIVYTLLRNIDREKPLDLFIHSGGGDIHTAYKLVKLFHRYSSQFRILIPEYAKSAATLVAIGAHSIEMCPIAELGPLDPMVSFGNGSHIPAFAIRNATKILEKEIASCKDTEVQRLKAEHILAPIAVKIDPYLLSATADTPEIAKRYGKKILTSIGYRGEVADRILKALIEKGAPSHAYVVDIDEAKELGLKAEEMKSDMEELCGLMILFLRQYEAACERDAHPMSQPYINLFAPNPPKKRKEEQPTPPSSEN